MVIARPVTKTKISTVGWGIPITDEVNRLSPLVDAATAATVPTPWTNVTLTGGWTNYSGFVTKYRKIGDIVYVAGGVQGGVVGGTIFFLPAGFRPTATNQFPASSYGSLTIVSVGSDGNVFPLNPCDTRFVGLTFSFATT